jgi:hypothetical protein
MAVKIRQYEQQTVPNTLGVVPRASPLQVSQAVPNALMKVAGDVEQAGMAIARMKEARDAERRRKEEEDGKAWAARNLAELARRRTEGFVRLQQESPPGAEGFLERFDEEWDEDEETVASQAPSETAKKFLRDRALTMRADMTTRAIMYEAEEGARFRGENIDTAANEISKLVAADPTQLAPRLAEWRATVAAADLRPDLKAKLLEDGSMRVAQAAVLGEVERDPAAAQEKLAARLGMTRADVATPSGPPATAQEVQAKYEAIGNSFGFVTTSITRTQAENDALPGAVKNSQHLESRGTARDWSIRGKTQAEIDAFVAALRAEGFQVITKPHGTGPHIHAELPPQGARKTPEAVLQEKPEGERVGDLAYDMLTVPQVVQLLGATESALQRKRNEMAGLIAAREQDDLAAYGDGKQPPNPITAQEFIAAFGGVEGAQRYQRYASAQKFATERARFKDMTPAQIQETLARMEPKPGAGYAAASQQYGLAVQAAQAVLDARASDPVQFAITAGYTDAEPIDFSNEEAMVAGLRKRAGVADMNSTKYGTRYTLLTNAEAAQLAQALGQMTGDERMKFVGAIGGNVGDREYRSIMSQLRKDSPVTAIAGLVNHVGGSVNVGDRTMTAAEVARMAMFGEDLLNPTKAASQQNGYGRFPMPSDTDLRRVWAEYTGNAYAGNAEQEGAAYQLFKAIYAGERARNGGYDGKLDEDVAKIAARAATGGLIEMPGSDTKIVPPWGMDPTFVGDMLVQEWTRIAPQAGYANVPFEALTLQTVADGQYAVMAGTGPLKDRNGAPIYLSVPRYTYPNGIPTLQVPAPAYDDSYSRGPGGGR